MGQRFGIKAMGIETVRMQVNIPPNGETVGMSALGIFGTRIGLTAGVLIFQHVCGGR